MTLRRADAPIHARTLSHLAEAIRSRRLSSKEIVAAHLRRIGEVNGRLNAVVTLADDALDQAGAADVELAHGHVRGPLHGVPITLKDSIDTAGLRTTAGTVGWRDRVPGRDATVAARLKAAGAIVVGKTNTPEFTWSDRTENDVFGRTNNPWDLERSPGGSSGGSAAIVAAGGSPLDIGSDTADSIRLPAHYCGVAGIKPTQGRVSRFGHNPAFHGIVGSWTQLGPIARSVDDLALVLSIIAGPDGEDPHVQPIELRDPAAVSVPALRVAFFADNGITTPTPATSETVRAAARALADEGAIVTEELPPGIVELAKLWWPIVLADGHAWLRRLIAAAGTPGTGWYTWLDDEPPTSSAELTAMLEQVDVARAALARFMQGIDVIVSPAGPLPPFRHDEAGSEVNVDTYCEAHNVSGYPSVVVPGAVADGFPIGVQVVARPWREDVALAAARAVETARGAWQAPPI
ncbi:MAG: amidase [Chloroflexi bacterium]|nr:amidase [Chloroflexota bacterium]